MQTVGCLVGFPCLFLSGVSSHEVLFHDVPNWAADGSRKYTRCYSTSLCKHLEPIQIPRVLHPSLSPALSASIVGNAADHMRLRARNAHLHFLGGMIPREKGYEPKASLNHWNLLKCGFATTSITAVTTPIHMRGPWPELASSRLIGW